MPMTASQQHERCTTKEVDSTLDREIRRFGAEMFAALTEEQPSALTRSLWMSRMMNWSMRNQEFKLNLFRLVDVLPSLRGSETISRHVNEYLEEPIRKMMPFTAPLFALKGAWRDAVVATLVRYGVRQIASMFIAGEEPRGALERLRGLRQRGLAFTIDLLGEFSVSEREAQIYINRYLDAIEVLAAEAPAWQAAGPIIGNHPGERSPICLSVKLTALYSQCSVLNFERSVGILSERLSLIVRAAKARGATIYVDAEDCANNGIIFACFERVFGSPEFRDLPWPGIVVQAYSKESAWRINSLLSFARRRGAPIAIRLVKGAYWDYEMALAAQEGHPPPLFSTKESSDAMFEQLSRTLFDHHEICMPAIASHNIRSLAHACCYADSRRVPPSSYELQMLYGMAEPIARAFSRRGHLVRLYVPLGDMFVGMGYLVRRLLENTSNESFLRHTFFDTHKIESLLRTPALRELPEPLPTHDHSIVGDSYVSQ